jgi:hypothetical protein
MQVEDKLAGERAGGRAYPGVGTSTPARLLNPQLIYICLSGFFLNLFTKKLKSAWYKAPHLYHVNLPILISKN